MYLVKYEFDYADEFDVYGFQILSDKEWENIQEAIKRTTYPQEYYFGTNEEIIIDSADELLRGFKATKITDEEVEVFKHPGLPKCKSIISCSLDLSSLFQTSVNTHSSGYFLR